MPDKRNNFSLVLPTIRKHHWLRFKKKGEKNKQTEKTKKKRGNVHITLKKISKKKVVRESSSSLRMSLLTVHRQGMFAFW